jgi:hypothetical protein
MCQLAKTLLPFLFATCLTSAAQAQGTGEALYKVYGEEHWNVSKARVVGDIDSDGCDDFLMGGPGGYHSDFTGHAFLISGIDGSVIRRHDGIARGEHFAADFCGLHDLNHDGVPEYAISAPRRPEQSTIGVDRGAVLIYDGATGAELKTLRDSFVLSRFGDALLGDTDFTGDGIPDLVVTGAKGAVLKIYDGSILLTVLFPDIVVETGFTPNFSRLGTRPLAGLGDLDGDGIAELAFSDSRRSHIFNTQTGASLFSGFGGYAADLGDITGDGISDFIFGYDGNGEYFSAGSAYVRSGADFHEIYMVYGDHFAKDNWSMGSTLAVVGDVTGDGLPDFITGAPGRDISATGSGVWLINGANGDILSEVRHNGIIVGYGYPAGGTPTPNMATNLEAADLDGDGDLEILIGAPTVHHKLGSSVIVRTGLILAGDLK